MISFVCHMHKLVYVTEHVIEMEACMQKQTDK